MPNYFYRTMMINQQVCGTQFGPQPKKNGSEPGKLRISRSKWGANHERVMGLSSHIGLIMGHYGI